MNNSQQALFLLDIGEATYSELDCLENLLNGVESPVDYWSLIQPDHLRQIISNAEKRLLSICYQYMTQRFNYLTRISARPMISQLQPSLKMMSKVKRFIDGDIDIIGKEFSHYEYSYQLFINSKRKYEECLIQVHGNQTNLATIVQFSATLINHRRSLATLNLAQLDFEKRNQQLNQHFAKILQKTAIHLEGMEERTFQAISRYVERLESDELGFLGLD
jgi:hypothetical protein